MTLLVVEPSLRGSAIASDLQTGGLNYRRDQGARRVHTQIDDEGVVCWLGQRKAFDAWGMLTPKKHEFGNSEIAQWIELVPEFSD
jgi:hypothetical protein